MSDKDKRKQIVKISVFITSVFVILFSITYAFLTQTLSGTRKVVITAGVLDLVLEEENEITISDALPMYDEVGMIQEDVFIFRLVNNTSVATNYVLKLQEIETGTLDKSIVKYGLIKEGERTIDFVSNIVDGVIDEGTVAGSDTIDYELRLWIDSEVTDMTEFQNKFLSFKLGAIAGQDTTLTDNDLAVDWSEEDGFLSQIEFDALMGTDYFDGAYFVKISNAVLTKENVVGLRGYFELNDAILGCGTDCNFEAELTQDFLNGSMSIDPATGALVFGENILFFVENTISNNGFTATPGVWTMAMLDEDGVTLNPQVTEFILGENRTISFAGVTKSLNMARENIFSGPVVNGIYEDNDDDGKTYFYRGYVDNLVKFGEYKEDHYIYRFTSIYNDNEVTSDFVSLEACKRHDETCSDANKVLKHAKGTPMYWRIVRINGDGTIRMIYAGTSPSSSGLDLVIGDSGFSEKSNELKYVGYTYDRTTTEVDSAAKTEIDRWYNTNFIDTKYDDAVAISKFCNDTSDYGEVKINEENTQMAFAPYKRAAVLLVTGNGYINPTFKCSLTTETFGGSYNLKIGMLTMDEVVGAGIVDNYLGETSDNEFIWTMSPMGEGAVFDYGRVLSGWQIAGDKAENAYGSLRPVINLKSNVIFKEGTDGSTSTPYELLGY